VLVNRFVLSDPCVTDESEMKFFAVFLSRTLLRVYVLSNISLLDKIFEIFADGPTLGSSLSFAIYGKNSSSSLRDGDNHVASVPDASLRVDP